MKLPWSLSVIIAILVIAAFGGLYCEFCKGVAVLDRLGGAALILTLAAVLAYMHHTKSLATEAYTLSASFDLSPVANHPGHYWFVLQNHSKFSISCWCNLNVTVKGQGIDIGGFYSEEKAFDLQPFACGRGHFDVRDKLEGGGHSWKELEDGAAPGDRNRLRLEIDFSYARIGEGARTRNPRQPYYFDFARNVMLLDF